MSDDDSQDREFKEGFGALVLEVTEARKQLIKNVNVVGNVVAEMRELTRQQQRQGRRSGINSLGAYAIFVVLIAGAFYWIYQARVDRIEFETNALRRRHAAMQTQIERLRDAERKRRSTENEAMAFYQLIKEQKLHEAISRYPRIAKLPLSRVEAALFDGWVQQKRASLAYGAYAIGMRGVSEQNWKRAVIEFRRSLKLRDRPPQIASLRYYLGVALGKLGSNREAAEELMQAISLGAEKTVAKHVRYLLGTTYEALGRRNKAQKAYRSYLKKYPNGSYARLTRRRLKALRAK